MSEILLHHYEMSPYARKLRLAFGLKGVAWRSVPIPVVMPKPDLTELTGGYRRTPVMQVGADVHCDTKSALRALERLHPKPSLFPGGDEATVVGLSRWAESSFLMACTVFIGHGGVFDAEFLADRQKMMPQVDFSRAPVVAPAKLLQLRANLDLLERQLGDGRAFLLGGEPSLADLSAWHPHAFLRAHPATAGLLAPCARVSAWLERVEALGEGERGEATPEEALALAQGATPQGALDPPAPLPDGLAAGDPVVVLPEEPGSGAVHGELLPSGVHEIVVRRRSERAGELAVHFPREDYLVVRAS